MSVEPYQQGRPWSSKDFQMTRQTAERILRFEVSPEERESSVVLRKALVKFKSGTRERFCLLYDGHKIRSAKEWKAFRSPQGFTAWQLDKLRNLMDR
jgi:hypothetical protein